jgi:hypothetical protein
MPIRRRFRRLFPRVFPKADFGSRLRGSARGVAGAFYVRISRHRRGESKAEWLFKPELGFIKSANLAGEMVARHWGECRGDNYDQQALSILAASRHALFSPTITDELLVYLAGHQKAHRKIGFLSPIKTSRDDRLAAADWFKRKATDFAEKTGLTQFFNNEVFFQMEKMDPKYRYGGR